MPAVIHRKRAKAQTELVRKYKPVGFDPKAFGRNGDRAVYVLHTLYIQQFRRGSKIKSLKQYYPLKSQHLKTILGKSQYRRTLDQMLRWNLIEYNANYYFAPGHHSKTYRIGTKYRRQRFTLYQIRNAWLCRNIRRQHLAFTLGMPAPYAYVCEWLDKLTIEEVPESVLEAAVNEKTRRTSGKRDALQKRREFFQYQIDNLKSGQHFTPIKDDYGRLHSVLTNLKADFRDYLRLNGRTLTSIDIKTSQLITAGITTYNHITTPYNTINPSIPNHTTTTTPSPSPTPNNQYTITIIECPTLRTPPLFWHCPDDLTLWFDQIASGDLYLYLMERADIPIPDDKQKRKRARAKFKRKLFTVLFGPNLTDSPVLTALCDTFPTIARAAQEIKQIDRVKQVYAERLQGGDTEGQARKYIKKECKSMYGAFAREMQRRESQIVFDLMVAKLMKEYPYIPVLTIHDSILTTPEHVTSVKGLMQMTFHDLGIRAQLEVTAYGTEPQEE